MKQEGTRRDRESHHCSKSKHFVTCLYILTKAAKLGAMSHHME